MSSFPANLFASPDTYLQRFDGEDAVFVAMDAAAYRRSIFLDHRISPAGGAEHRIAAASLPRPVAAPPLGWIFHMAHCGSTLLARALGELGENLILREPFALRQLAFDPDPARLSATFGLLARRYAPAAPTVVKANVPVNFLLPQITLSDPAARAIMLYCALPDYLLAILRSDNHRTWLRTITTQFASHLGDLAGRSDAELAAALWLAQTQRFASALAAMPQARSLDAEDFFARPAETLAAAARLLGIPATVGAIDALVSGPLFATYSKNPSVAFDNAARIARRNSLRASLAGEIDAARAWLDHAGAEAAEMAKTLEERTLAR